PSRGRRGRRGRARAAGRGSGSRAILRGAREAQGEGAPIAAARQRGGALEAHVGLLGPEEPRVALAEQRGQLGVADLTHELDEPAAVDREAYAIGRDLLP